MKKRFSIISVALFAFIINFNGIPAKAPSHINSPKTISISFSGAFALYPLVQTWAAEYNKTHPDVRFDIQAGGAGKGLTDCLGGAVDVGMFSRELTDAEKAKGVWSLALCKDAVIPTMNAKSPFLKQLQIRGVKKAEFNSIFVDRSISTWGDLLGTNNTKRINVYTRADAAGAAVIDDERPVGAGAELDGEAPRPVAVMLVGGDRAVQRGGDGRRGDGAQGQSGQGDPADAMRHVRLRCRSG